MEKLKKSLVNKLKGCNDVETLRKISYILDLKNEQTMVAEDRETYSKPTAHSLTDEQWAKVALRSEAIKNGTSELISWKNIKADLKKKYGS